MAKKTKGEEPKNLIIQQTTITQVNRGNADIKKWRDAIRSAESVSSPNRVALYDLYADVEIDGHLISVMEKRKAAILKKKISFVRNGEEDPNVMLHLKSPWFFLFMNDLLDTIWWGNSLFQFYRADEWIKYDLLPRKHVKSEKKILAKTQSDQTGISYVDNPEFPNCLEVSFIKRLGMLNYACPYVIYKRNGLGDFAEFLETYGIPMREGIYDGYDDEVRKKLVADLTAAGRSTVFVHPRGTDVNIKDSAFKASSTGMYDKMIEICNAEMSKLAVGNTMTTEQGKNGARSLGEVQKQGEESLNVTDETWVYNVLNYEMADIFANLGINTTGGEFVLTEKKSEDLGKRVEVDIQVSTKVPISDDYWYKTYGIDKPENYDELKAQMAASTANPEAIQGREQEAKIKEQIQKGKDATNYYEPPGNDIGFWNKVFSFFVKAPHTGHTEYCQVCGGAKYPISNSIFKNEYSTQIDDALTKAARSVFVGDLVDGQTSPELALSIGNVFDEALRDHFTDYGNMVVTDTNRLSWINNQRNGLYTFSAAKSYAEMNAMRDLVFDADGNTKSEHQFLTDVRKNLKAFNETYMQAEYDAVVNGTIQGQRWLDIEDNRQVAPYLKYVTANDDRVRDTHRQMNGIIERVDSQFWTQYYPPNGWRCRCTTMQLSEREAIHQGYKEGETDSNMKFAGTQVKDPYWRKNTGQTEILEIEGTAYLKHLPGKQLSAVKNYGMKKYEDIASGVNAKTPLTKDEYLQWWQSNTVDNTITIKDYTGMPVKFDGEFRTHMTNRAQDHYGYADQIQQLLQQPNEVWYSQQSKERGSKTEWFKVFVKYDKNGPVCLLVDKNNKPNSLYLVKPDAWEKMRMGILAYRK